MPVLENRIWSLNEENEIATKQIWAILLKQFGYDLDNFTFEDLENPHNFVASKSPNALPKLSPASILLDLPPVSEKTQNVYRVLNGDAKVFGDLDNSVDAPQKDSHPSLKKYSSPQLQQTFLASLRNDSPDNEILRFVRARKFQVLPAVEMTVACLAWKAESHQVNKWVMQGDAHLEFSKKYPKLIRAFEMEKVYLRGHGKNGGMTFIVRVKNHFGSDCPEEDFERLICLVIEYAKLCSKSYSKGVDGTNILFDMSGFSLKNADLSAIKFLAKAFEANYPESLSCIWIHQAPWVFNAVWKIIKGWLDPAVAAKVQFTKSLSDLESFVDKKYIPKHLGGSDDFIPQYVSPTVENSSVLRADEKSAKLFDERNRLLLAFLDTTISWIKATTSEESTRLLNAKIQLGGELAQNYVCLDPYIRSRGPFDRDGTIPSVTI